VVGEVGSDLRVEYTAMGDAINLAARMEQSAPPGGILITHDTYRHVRGVFDVLRQEPLVVKGRREPVQTYLVEQAKPRAFRKPMRGVEGIETRMIGRQAELSRLQEAFYTAMEDREPQMATIVGDAGVGKSRLLHEFDIWAEALAEQYYFFKGRALQEMQRLPYSLIRDLFAFRFLIEDTDPLPVAREKLEQGVTIAPGDGEESQMRAHFIGHLVGFEIGESSHLAGVLDDPKQLHDRALTCMADYFKALAAQLPVLILLEDLHWADDSSLDVLNHLALALTDQPVMIVCAARPALFERRPHWGEGQAFHRKLTLEPLTKRNTRRLLDEILQKVDQVPDTLGDLVVAGAEGNPFFVEELVKMLVEDGVILKGEDDWRVEPQRLTEVRVPPTLRGVLQARLDRLPAQERTVLQQASVVGRLFWDRAVARISESADEGVAEAEVLDTLSALRGREMVFQRETTAIAGAQEYIFKHAVLREVTYKGLLKRLRRIYHGLVADWLMEQGGERAGEYTGLIADHLELAGRSAQAIEYLLEAGDRARGLYAHQEAIGAYQRALELLKEQGEHERAARTLMKLGLTHHTAFEFERARQAYEEGFALWQKVAQRAPAVTLPSAPHALRLEQRDPLTLDAAMAQWEYDFYVIHQLFRGLVELGPRLEVLPDLARSWEVLEGGRRYVFHLQEEAQWSDGAPVTAYDVEFAWKRALNPTTGAGHAELLHGLKGAEAYYRGDVSESGMVGVRAVDDTTLLVELESPTGYFLQLLSHAATFPVPRHVVQAHGEAWAQPGNLVTNGPFALAEWRRGESLVLVRSAHYDGGWRGNVERVEITLLGFSAWREKVALYESDELDALSFKGFPAEQCDRLRRRHADQFIFAPALQTTCVTFNVTRPPLDDGRVRRALTLATDREVLAGVSLGGYVLPATGGLVPPGMPGHSPGIGLPHEPERARLLLAEAGYPGGRGFPALRGIMPTRSARWMAVADYLEAQWQRELGVEVRWEYGPVSEFWDRVQKEQPHLHILGWAADYPDPDNFLRIGFGGEKTAWRNAEYDELVARARRLLNQEERMSLYRRADRIIVEEAAFLALKYGQSQVLIKPWVKGCSMSATAFWSPWKDVIIEPH
jgi:ABC-type oligopeptide transport system substrate-binding subunit